MPHCYSAVACTVRYYALHCTETAVLIYYFISFLFFYSQPLLLLPLSLSFVSHRASTALDSSRLLAFGRRRRRRRLELEEEVEEEEKFQLFYVIIIIVIT